MSYDEFLVRRVICLDYALIMLLAWVLQVSHHVFVFLLDSLFDVHCLFVGITYVCEKNGNQYSSRIFD